MREATPLSRNLRQTCVWQPGGTMILEWTEFITTKNCLEYNGEASCLCFVLRLFLNLNI